MNLYEKCVDIFENAIIKEATTGRIDSYFLYNVIFNTKLENKFYEACAPCDNLLIPTLNIKDKKNFYLLLSKYVHLCLNFYDKSNFCEEILDNKLYYDNKICPDKTIIALLFANATVEDFNDPLIFLQRRIDFISNSHVNNINLGYCELLNCDLNIVIEKDIINNETPFQFKILALANDEKFLFPSIKFGISNNSIYVYAIQNGKMEKNTLTKKINRLLYKLNEGFDGNFDNYELYGQGNLKDITPSFVVALNIFISYFYNLGIKEFIASSILIERWNAKRMANNVKYLNGKIDLDELEKNNILQNDIQLNLSDKFIRTFLRLAYHYNDIDITSYPFDVDSFLHLNVSGMELCSNNLLLSTKDIVCNNKKTR